MKEISKSLQETHKIAERVLAHIQTIAQNRSDKEKSAAVLALTGDLGAGKTAFVKAVAKAYGITEEITSPTFVIMKRYDISPEFSRIFEQLFHIDAYRLEHASELQKLGWDAIVADSRNLICIEWPEKVSGCIPAHAFHIQFTHVDETTREIEFS